MLSSSNSPLVPGSLLTLSEREYVVRILLLDGLHIRKPPKEHDARHASIHQPR